MKLSLASSVLGASALLVDRTASAEYSFWGQNQNVDQYNVPDAGKCMTAVASKISSGQLERQNVNWNTNAAYYASVDSYYRKNYESYNNGNYNNANNANNANANQNQQAQGQYPCEEQAQEGRQGQEGEGQNPCQAQYQAPAVTRTGIYNDMVSLAETLGLDIADYDNQAQNAEADQAQNANANNYNNKWASAASANCNLDLLSNYVLAYDQEVAETLGMDDRCKFAEFYDVTYRLVKQGGCEDEGENANHNNDKEFFEKIFENCQDEYAAIGIDVNEIDVNGERLEDLIMHIKLEQAIQGSFFATADVFEEYLKELGFDLDDKDQMNIIITQEVTTGDLTMFLLENGYYGSKNQGQDWTDILTQYFLLKGIVGNSDEVDELIEKMDLYTATAIYNAVYDVEEYGCQRAMKDQFGAWSAGRQGYINQGGAMVDTVLDSLNMDRNDLPKYMTDPEGNLTAGAVAGISFAVIAAVALISFGTYRVGRSYVSTDKKAPLMSDTYQKDGNDIKAAMEARKLARFRTSIV